MSPPKQILAPAIKNYDKRDIKVWPSCPVLSNFFTVCRILCVGLSVENVLSKYV